MREFLTVLSTSKKKITLGCFGKALSHFTIFFFLCFPDLPEEAEEAKANGSGVNLHGQMYINKILKFGLVLLLCCKF